MHVPSTLQQLRQLGEGPVALLVDERANLFQGGLVHLRDRAPTVRAWHRCSLRAREVEVALHSVQRDREPLRQLPHASFATGVGVDDPLPQVEAVGAHEEDDAATVGPYAKQPCLACIRCIRKPL